MARGIGIAMRGAGKALLKRRKVVGGLKERIRPKSFPPGVKGKGPALATKPADKYRKALGPLPKPTKKKPIISKDEIKGGLKGAALTYAFLKLKESGKTKKEAKAKEDKKLKEATEKHEKKTKENRKKYGKHHG